MEIGSGYHSFEHSKIKMRRNRTYHEPFTKPARNHSYAKDPNSPGSSFPAGSPPWGEGDWPSATIGTKRRNGRRTSAKTDFSL
ncbi:unnamed protein product [Nezara viridula]|uniref:Uncharacterized protein n=1 Tax=Nezara viridula TaxID=85310 RepID=A0A9P0H830_NEZVI|nr:unnamed protein product [Nezara viridula]